MIEVKHFPTGYFIPVSYGLGVWPDGELLALCCRRDRRHLEIQVATSLVGDPTRSKKLDGASGEHSVPVGTGLWFGLGSGFGTRFWVWI